MKSHLTPLFCVSLLLGWATPGLQAQALTNGLLREVYSNIPGSAVADLVNSPDFPDHPSSANVLTNALEAPLNFDLYYGQRLRGFVVPPMAGFYTFWISSDDQSVLYLSPDNNPKNKQAIANVVSYTASRQWDKEDGQMSVPIYLEADQRYYLEVLMKQGVGADNLAVRWQLPDGLSEEPIPASRLIPANVPVDAPTIAVQPADAVALEAGSAVFTVEVLNLDSLAYQWQRNGIDIPGAIWASYTNPVVSLSEQGARYSCSITNRLGKTKSQPASLAVIPDTTPPVINYVLNEGDREITVVFSEPVYVLNGPSSFALDKGLKVLTAASGADPRTILLTTTPLTLHSAYTLTFNEVIDRAAAGNPIAPNSQFTFVAAEFSPQDVGSAKLAGSFLPVADGFRLTASGSGVGGNADQFQFSFQERFGNFDFKVQVASLDLTDPWSQAGLMARESLDPDSRFAAVLATPSISGCFFQSRAATGAVAVITGNCPVNYPDTWLRLKREGNTFSGYASVDGNQWLQLGSMQLSFTNTNKFFFGLAVASHNTNQTTVAELRHLATVTDNPTVGPLPPDFEPLGPSSRRTPLVISEIMYHPLPRSDGKDLEFVELFNSGPVPEDLSGYRLAGTIDFTFPPGTVMPAGDFLVVAKSPGDLVSVYGPTKALGGYNGRLANGTLRLLDNLGAVLLELAYSGEPPWPAAADGAGHSLVLAHPSLGEDNPLAWAASDLLGGSPGRREIYHNDPLRTVAINEFLANTELPDFDFIELYNHSTQTVNLSGCFLSDRPDTNKFLIPYGTVIPARAFVVFKQDQLGFALSSAGETIYFRSADGTRMLDAVRFGPQAQGVSTGRCPDGGPTFRELGSPTPGAANKDFLRRNIVINEIMHHPITGDDNGQYVELYNRGTNAIDLEGWRFVAGIDFVFPANTVIPRGGYLVVAKNAVQLMANYPNLGSTNLVGNFGGTLAHKGERLALAMPVWELATNANNLATSNRLDVVVDEVTYSSGARWGKWADGGGSSLELIDPQSDNRLAANWADSEETRKSQWTTIEHTGVLDLGDTQGNPPWPINNVQILLLGEGECLVDNVEVIGPGGLNLVANSTFEGGTNGYLMRGTHRRSTLQDGGGYESQRCLYLRASARGDAGPNQIMTPLTTPLIPGTTATIRAKVRWLRGWPEILLRLRGNWLEAAGAMPLPTNLGTPGARNSRIIGNAGPAIYAVAHHPILPAANEPVVVTARAHDPNGIASVFLSYRIDPALSYHTVRMVDDGTAGDAVAGDGIYSAIIPGQLRGYLVAFSIGAIDWAALPATATFPSDAPSRECLVRFGESVPAGSFTSYHLWFTQATFDEWSHREQGSNDPLDATFAYGNSRVIYNIGAYYHGSPFHWSGYDTPTGRNCAYNFVFPNDNRLLGVTDFVLTMPSNLGSDPAIQREQVTHWIGKQLGIPNTYRRFVYMFANGVRRGDVFEDAQHPDTDFLKEWFSNDSDGDLYKSDDWFEFNQSLGWHNVDATLENFTTTGGAKKLARYRWNWRKRAVNDSANSYTNLLALVDAVNTAGAEDLTRHVEALVDVDEWMRTFASRHIVGDWDSYGYRRGKNMFAYKPEHGKWQLLNWDISFDLGLGDGTSSSLFDVTHFDGRIDPITDRMFKHPPFLRVYLRALEDAVRGPLLNANVDPIMDAKYTALKDNGVGVSDPRSIKDWIKNRRLYIQKVLATNAASFAILSNQGQPFRTNRNLVTLEGTAPVSIETLSVNGIAYPVTWTSVTGWRTVVPVHAGDNQLTIQGHDHRHNTVPDAVGSVVISYSGFEERPEDHLVINEIMYHPAAAGTEYVELYNTSLNQAFDLSRYRLDGLSFTFADGTIIPPQGFALVVQNRGLFEAAYGTDLPVVGEFSGQLQHGGETLRLIKPGATADEDVVVRQVTYDNNAPWPAAADGTGASLQLLDPSQDNNRVGNWDAVSTNGLTKPRWQFVSVTGTASSSRMSLTLSSSGEVILDDLNLVAGIVPRVGNNLLANGSFESPLPSSWQVSPSYAPTAIKTDTAYAGSSALHLVATAADGAPRSGVTQEIQPPLAEGQLYTLSYWYLPNGSASDSILTVKLDGDGLVSSQSSAPAAIARLTPGKLNSVRLTLPAFPALWINEIQPLNIGAIQDQAGQSSPWIELYNAGSKLIDLTGLYLTDSYTNLLRWSFPSNTVMREGQYLLIWADGESNQTSAAELHANFRLIPSTGEVALVRMDLGQPTVLDYIDYANLAPGQSLGYSPDGTPGKRRIFMPPTPAAPNLIAPPSVVINEWMAANTSTLADPADADFEDWFELYNPQSVAVDLSRYTLTDDLTNHTKFVIPAGTIIAPHGFLLVWADGQANQNQPGRDLHVNFKLSREGESLALFTPTGALLDSVTYGPQTNNVSQGRWPDGQPAPFYFTTTPTPGAANANPNGATSALRITGIAITGGAVTLTFQTQPGGTYLVQYKDRLTDPAWSSLGDSILATAGETSKADSSLSINSQRYYRVEQLSQP